MDNELDIITVEANSTSFVKQAFGEVITRKRTELGYKQRLFSRMVGISNSHMRSIESGMVSPTLVTLFKIASALDMRPDDLVAEAYDRYEELCSGE